MNRITRWAWGSWLCTSLLLSSAAHADVANSEECSVAGAACPEEEGCTIRQVGTERGVAAIFLALGLGALTLARRRG